MPQIATTIARIKMIIMQAITVTYFKDDYSKGMLVTQIL